MQIDIPQESQLSALRTLWKEVFADADVYLGAFEKTDFCADRCRCVTVGDEVVAALYWFDCQFRGTFRVPGTGKTFAMYRKLNKSDLPVPSYFGLAFD